MRADTHMQMHKPQENTNHGRIKLLVGPWLIICFWAHADLHISSLCEICALSPCARSRKNMLTSLYILPPELEKTELLLVENYNPMFAEWKLICGYFIEKQFCMSQDKAGQSQDDY